MTLCISMAGSAGADDIKVPTEPRAKAAFDALERNCSRCHQVGRLTKRERPPRNFGNILKFDEVAANPDIIARGNPEGSKLFRFIINQEMPYDVHFEGDQSVPPPSLAEIEAIAAWIRSL